MPKTYRLYCLECRTGFTDLEFAALHETNELDDHASDFTYMIQAD